MVNPNVLPEAGWNLQRLADTRTGLLSVIVDIVQTSRRVFEAASDADERSGWSSKAKGSQRARLVRVVVDQGVSTLGFAGQWLKAAALGAKHPERRLDAAAVGSISALASIRQPAKKAYYITDALVLALACPCPLPLSSASALCPCVLALLSVMPLPFAGFRDSSSFQGRGVWKHTRAEEQAVCSACMQRRSTAAHACRGGGGVQEQYREVVQELKWEAGKLLQEAAIELHSSSGHMEALLTAHEVHEWGSTLSQAALSATRRCWEMPQLLGTPPPAACVPVACLRC